MNTSTAKISNLIHEFDMRSTSKISNLIQDSSAALIGISSLLITAVLILMVCLLGIVPADLDLSSPD